MTFVRGEWRPIPHQLAVARLGWKLSMVKGGALCCGIDPDGSSWEYGYWSAGYYRRRIPNTY